MTAGLKWSCAIPERVGQHEAALGVGVDHLDGLPGHRFHDVARPLRGARGHVLDEAGDADDVHARLRPASAFMRPSTVPAPPMSGYFRRGLDGNAAGIERDALAEGRGCSARLAAPFIA